jgi:hypothetical protein
MNLEGTGIDRDTLGRYIQEEVYSLPGVDRQREVFSVLLTGSRAWLSGSLGPPPS